MNIEILNIFLLANLFVTIFGCFERDIFKETPTTEQPESDRYGNRYYYTTQRPARVILNRTITCSGVPSHLYTYREADFEQYLKIQSANISTLEQSAFVQFTTIIKLFLTHLQIENILPGAFNGLTRLKELHLSHNELTEVPKGVFNSLHRLEILTLNDNKIHHIENMGFTGADSLVQLHLHRNKIEKLEDGAFKTQKHLRYLDLSHNPITKFSLEGLSNLDSLNMSQTLLKEFDTDVSSLTMKTINLESSQLSKIDFAFFPKLDDADLSNNKIEILENCQRLDTNSVNLTHNKIGSINDTFNGVFHLYISHNQLEILENSLFNESELVIVLDFSFNEILTLEKYVFRGLQSLTKLFLQNNKISKLDPVLFKDLSRLTILNMSDNCIEEFQFGTFDSLSNLQVLDVSSNKLLDLHQYTLNSLSNLHSFYFDNNQISTMNVKDLKSHLLELRLVSLDDNPWKCQELVKISQTFKTLSVLIKDGHNYDVENFHGIACQNQKDFTAVVKDFQKSVDESVKHSKMDAFFNRDFQNSKFVQYFDKDYSQSNSFKFLSNYRIVFPETQKFNNSVSQKLTSLQVIPNEHENKILIFSAVVQVLIVFILVCGFYCMISFLKKVKYDRHTEPSSQIELC